MHIFENLLLEGQASIFIAVKEFYEAISFSLADRKVSVVTQEVNKLLCRDRVDGIAVEALEGRVWGKVSDGA